MLKFVARRLLWAVFITIGVTVLTFLLMNAAPGDPAEMIALARYGHENLTAEDVERVRKKEGLDAPIHVQYGKWVCHVLRGDLGKSLWNEEPVADEILLRFPATLQLASASMIVALLIAIPAGVLAAVKQNSLVDHCSMTAALIGLSMPNFWLALLLVLVFSLHLGWFPVCGKGSLAQLVLPSITLGSGMAAIITRMTRSSMLEVLGQNYIRTARAKGLLPWAVIGVHAFRNALIPVVTIIGMQFAFLMEGSVIVEVIFAWPGIGRLLVDAIFSRDFPVIQGCVLVIAVVFALVNLGVDILYAWIDPRIRFVERSLS